MGTVTEEDPNFWYDGKTWRCRTCNQPAIKVSSGGENAYCVECRKSPPVKKTDQSLSLYS